MSMFRKALLDVNWRVGSDAIAKTTGIHYATVRRLILGSDPHLSTVVKLCAAYPEIYAGTITELRGGK